ncbi:unnamed protein product, partial [Mesorhabditis belari]|uniref:SH3 domain-containing protein n=1 Tax=Mesorhabditis belari TaxID=2138241 RepID=A0AAF3FBN0_9BILA
MSYPRTPSIIDPIGPYVQSQFSFRGEYTNELSFGSNEIIKLTRKIDQDWLEGELNGKVGIFPSGYVQNYTRRVNSSNNDVGNAAPHAQAIFPFQGEYANELSFGANEIIKLTRKIDKDWLEGDIGGKVGIFPAVYVQILVDLDAETTRDSKTGDEFPVPTSIEGIEIETFKSPPHSQENEGLMLRTSASLSFTKETRNECVYQGASSVQTEFLLTHLSSLQNNAAIEEARDVYKCLPESQSYAGKYIPLNSFPSTLSTSILDINSSTIGGADDSNTYTSGSTNLAKHDEWEVTGKVDNESQTEILETEELIVKEKNVQKPSRITVNSMVKKIGRIKARMGQALGKHLATKNQKSSAVSEQPKTPSAMDQSHSDKLIDFDDPEPAIPMITPLQPIPIAAALSPPLFNAAISEPILNELRPINWGIPPKTTRAQPVLSRNMVTNRPLLISPFTPTQSEIFFC